MALPNSPEELNSLFRHICRNDLNTLELPDYFARWLFMERLHARGERKEMSFESFEGPTHIRKFFLWHRKANLIDYFRSSWTDELTEISYKADMGVFTHYGLPANDEAIRKIARYNMQDYIFQHAYVVPPRQQPKVLLDFGAGHGRIANLSFNTPAEHERLKSYIAIDAIPSTYFTQIAYFSALGLKLWDYFDHYNDELSQAVVSKAIHEFDVVHIPTWRFDLIPDNIVDMISCVQVLKELPGELVAYVLPQFSRVSAPAGALYIRDHVQFHNPNHMPIDLLVKAAGYSLEFAPQVKDRSEIHGVPRVWRKVSPDLFL